MRFFTSLVVVALGMGVAAAAPCPSTDLAAIRQQVEVTCPCADAASKGAYVKCVKDKLKADGVKGSCNKGMKSTAAKSVCGRSGFVVCCQPGKKGKVVKAAKCKKGTPCEGVANPAFSVYPLSGADCSAAGACPVATPTTTSTTGPQSTSSTTSTTTTPVTTTTSTTEPNLCVGGLPNGTPETGEECDDDNVNPTDGCTNACTDCSNGAITPPETCDDSNLTSGDGCDANCKTTGCGNGLIVGAETCDDGNTSNNDNCPSDCIIDACTPQTGTDFTVSVNLSGNNVGALSILLDYPEGKVSIPGSAGAIPSGILTDYPEGALPGPNDHDFELFNFVLGELGGTVPSGLLFKIHFETCQNATAPVSGDFTCTVLEASDPNGNPISTSGITCSAVVP